jgi:glycerophosphoryl diester phosphodiesterase
VKKSGLGAFRLTRLKSVVLAGGATLAFSAVLILGSVSSQVYAVDVFGALRAPGEVAFVAGHRGDRSLAPENTMPAFEFALDGPMAFVETDVQLSGDGVPVLFHDVTLERTTNGHGEVSDYTAAQLARLDAGAWYNMAYAGTRIPTLDQFLTRLARSNKKALVELKFGWTTDQLRGVVDLVDRHHLRSQVVLQAFSIDTLSNLQQVAPQFPRVMLVRELPADPVPMAHRFGVLALATTAKAVAVAPDAVTRLHEAGLGVICYTLNSEATWNDVRALGVDGIITDIPSDLDAWLAASATGT